jgi:2-aminoethylphosphonate-pyruvate transaminase
MDIDLLPDNPYLLLTPGPLSTSKTVKAAMLRDWCTWDEEYKSLTQSIRTKLTALAVNPALAPEYTATLMQGSGTFVVESVLGTALPRDGKLLVLSNGRYGERIAEIADRLRIEHAVLDFGETRRVDPSAARQYLQHDPAITHVAMVHCETTTGMLNPIETVGCIVKAAGKTFIVDAMSSFGGVPLDMSVVGADFLISSANKCIQGAPGFGFALAKRGEMQGLLGRARSLSLDLYDQWRVMEEQHGKWRFTSPTHVVRAFAQALEELEEEGGVSTRAHRYSENQRLLSAGMRELGFKPLLPEAWQSPIITAFHAPQHQDFAFARFYEALKIQGFVIYPGKVTNADTFRIGTIGCVAPEDVRRLLQAVRGAM